MNDLQIFENPEFGSVRTVEIDGTPWLVGKDVATALGYANPRIQFPAMLTLKIKRLPRFRAPPAVNRRCSSSMRADCTA